MKKLPPTLLVALAIDLVVIATSLAMMIGHSSYGGSLRFELALDGADVVSYVLGIAGFVELSRRNTGLAATGLRIAIGAYVLGLAMTVFWQACTFFQPHWSEHTWQVVTSWAFFATSFLPTLGLVIATSQRHRRAAVAGAVVLIVAAPVPPLARLLYGWITGWKASITVQDALHVALTVAILLLSALLADGEPTREPRSAAYGLRTIGSALWLRVIAAVTVAGLTLMLMMGHAGEDAFAILKLAMFSGAIVNALSLVMLTWGALAVMRSGIGDLARWPIVAVAAGATWCLGVAAFQLPYTYRMLYGSDGFGASGAQEHVQALAVAVPLVATGTIAAIAIAIAGFAARRGLEKLRSEAQSKGTAFVVLMLVTVGLQVGMLPKADTLGSFAALTIICAVCSLWATVVIARLCTAAAEAANADPGLPTAKIV
jgi:hypothetical protein